MTDVYDFDARLPDGSSVSLRGFTGKVLLIVNTASECGFTPQYEGLEALHRKYRDRGLVVLGFPCNQFGGQEPGPASQIGDFCKKNYGVSFPLFDKIDVNGGQAHPLYRWLAKAAPGVLGTQRIKWNFTKFLVDRQGQVVDRYAPATKPEDIAIDIESLLA
jgi:glutathione peroxidase